jgi:hypothetical protein
MGNPDVSDPESTPANDTNGRTHERGRESGVPVGPSPLAGLRYYFSLRASLDVLERERLQRGPWGTRLHLLYRGDQPQSVYTREELYGASWNVRYPEGAGDVWHPLEGVIASGADFSLVRSDAVFVLDGRITLRAHDQTLIDAVYSGTADLCTTLGPAFSKMVDAGGNDRGDRSLTAAYQHAEARFYEEFMAGGLPTQEGPAGTRIIRIPVWFNVKFETASGPWLDAPGEDMSWVKKRYLSHQANFWKYRLLVRRPFAARGELTFTWSSRGATPHEAMLEVDVFELTGLAGAIQ